MSFGAPFQLVFLSLLLSSTLNTHATPGKRVNLGVIVPFYDSYFWTWPEIAPALEIALERLTFIGLLPGYRLRAIVADSKCSATSGPVKAIDMHYKQTANVFIGLACDYALAPVARYSTFWNTPVISLGGLNMAFDDKTEYKLLTRIVSPYTKMAVFVQKLLAQWNWNTIGLLYQKSRAIKDGTGCFSQVEALLQTLSRSSSKYNKWFRAFDSRQNHMDDYTSLLQEATSKSRVIILCADANSVRQIMIKAGELGYTKGKYAFLFLNLFGSTSELERSWYRAEDTPEVNAMAKAAHESMMILTLRKPVSQEYHAFADSVRRRSSSAYNVTYEGEKTTGVSLESNHQVKNTIMGKKPVPTYGVNIFASSLYDAVVLYTLALNETLAAGCNISNGQEIANRMRNRSFEGISGTVSIDDNGDRNGDYSLLDLNPVTGKFEVVANYYGNRKQYEAVAGKMIHWPGQENKPPESGLPANGEQQHHISLAAGVWSIGITALTYVTI